MFNKILDQITSAILKLDWSPGTGKFTINPTYKGNGVKPIKYKFLDELAGQGWKLEQRIGISSEKRPEKIDAIIPISEHLNTKLFAVEWETGNISSSHRALNKIILGILHGKLIGGH
jgi:hypothetical protein